MADQGQLLLLQVLPSTPPSSSSWAQGRDDTVALTLAKVLEALACFVECSGIFPGTPVLAGIHIYIYIYIYIYNI